jgi:hypothetical protein
LIWIPRHKEAAHSASKHLPELTKAKGGLVTHVGDIHIQPLQMNLTIVASYVIGRTRELLTQSHGLAPQVRTEDEYREMAQTVRGLLETPDIGAGNPMRPLKVRARQAREKYKTAQADTASSEAHRDYLSAELELVTAMMTNANASRNREIFRWVLYALIMVAVVSIANMLGLSFH